VTTAVWLNVAEINRLIERGILPPTTLTAIVYPDPHPGGYHGRHRVPNRRQRDVTGNQQG
jgi:hypothetical protein